MASGWIVEDVLGRMGGIALVMGYRRSVPMAVSARARAAAIRRTIRLPGEEEEPTFKVAATFRSKAASELAIQSEWSSPDASTKAVVNLDRLGRADGGGGAAAAAEAGAGVGRRGEGGGGGGGRERRGDSGRAGRADRSRDERGERGGVGSESIFGSRSLVGKGRMV